MFFDDLHLLRTIDRLERDGQGAGLWSGGQLIKEVLDTKNPVLDDAACRSFIRELELARDAGLLTFKFESWGPNMPSTIEAMGASNYLNQMQHFELTPFGHDRANMREFKREPPEPGEDDGKPITLLTLRRIAEIIASAYEEHELRLFLIDGGIPVEMIPPLDDELEGMVTLLSVFNGGDSHTRRVLQRFLGRWLAQDLDSGPDQDQAAALLADLGRQGWFVRDDKLVRRDPIRRATVAPLLGGDLLSNLHPAIQAAARPSFSVGRRAEAVFEAFKAIELRVRTLTGGTESGVTLMGRAFDGNPPRLTLNDGNDHSDADEQHGFALIFKGAMQGVRNPKAHAPFEELEERRALDYLGFASLLMRRLDDAEERLS